jgi:transposase
MDALEFETDIFGQAGAGTVVGRSRLHHAADHPRYRPTLAAVFVAEIGDVRRFTGPDKLASWAGLTPETSRVRRSSPSGHPGCGHRA